MNIPKHVAIIPDGNRRWAKNKKLPSFRGHQYSAEKILPDLIEKSADLGIKYFTFWALSTENLQKRTKVEIDSLFKLTRFFLKNKINEFKKNNIRLKVIGDVNKLPGDIRHLMESSIKETLNNTKLTVIFAVNYGGRDELVRGMQRIQNSKLEEKITEKTLEKYLDTDGIPDPDLIIRTGGDKRLSGFLPWQSIYSELYFTDLFFPEFNSIEFEKAIDEYSSRKRRFGK